MRNEYEIRGDVTAVFLKRKDGTRLEMVIDTVTQKEPMNILGIGMRYGVRIQRVFIAKEMLITMDLKQP